MRIGVFVCDKRMNLVSEALKKDAQIIEIDEEESQGRLRQIAPELDAVIFPSWGIEEDGFVIMKMKGLYVMDFLERLRKDCIVFSGKQSTVLNEFSFKKIYWLEDEEVLSENAKLTAEGCLGCIISKTDKSLDIMRFDVLGSGRCALAVVQLLKCLNLNVRIVSTSKRTDESKGIIHYEQWKKADPYEIIINTAPAILIDRETASCWKNHKTVFDLASVSCCDAKVMNHPFLTYHHESALPSRFCVKTAAELITNKIRKDLCL